MKYAYIPATTFQKQIYLSDLTSTNGTFELIWCWKLKSPVSSEILSPCLQQLIDKYEILRTSIVNYHDTIVQKIAQSASQDQILLKEHSSKIPEASFLKDLAEPSEGITFIIFQHTSQLVHSIYGVASHSIIDATSIDLLRSEICYCITNGTLPPHIYEFQFADLTDSLDSLEQTWPDICLQEDISEDDDAILSVNLDSRQDDSSTWLSPPFDCNTFLPPLPTDVQSTLLGRLFQHLISKLGFFLNKPILHIGLALDARNFLNLTSLVGPAVLLKKGAFSIRELHHSKSLNLLSDFFYSSTLGSNISNLIAPTDSVQILFNLIIDSSSSDDSALLNSVDFDNNRGANVPLTLDCRVNASKDQVQIFLRSNSSTFNSLKLSQLGNYLISQQEHQRSKFISPYKGNDLMIMINSALERGGSDHCLHWIHDAVDLHFTYDQLRHRVEIYHQYLLKYKISSCRVLTRCLDPFEYIASILALVLTQNIFVPLDERRNNDSERVEFIESICDYELKFDSQSRQPILLSFPVRTNSPTDEITTDDVCLMFTSGSTGIPKGVRITSRGILRLLQLGVERSWTQSNFLMHSDIGFDASLFEIWIPILSGGKITCVDHLLLMRKGVVVDVDCAWLSVSMLTQLLRCTNNILKAKVICTGGEHVPYSLVSTIDSCGFFESGNKLFNGYGPTESTTFIFLDEINPSTYAQREGTMSRLLPGSEVALQSFLTVETPVGGIGELIVSGDGVANGYLNSKPDSPFFYNSYNELSYRTGDFFERISDASYQFIGRADDLIKISGYRVSIEQIRSILSSYLKSSDVFVLKIANDNSLACAAFVQSSQLVTHDYISNIVQLMRSSVPHYLIPKQVILIDDIPITPNGKVDKAALRRLYISSSSNTATLISAEELLSTVSSLPDDVHRDITHLTQDSLALVNLHSRLCDIGFTGDLYSLSNCCNTSDLARFFIKDKTTLATSPPALLSDSIDLDYIFTGFEVDINSFDRVSLLCFLTTLFEAFSFDIPEPFYLIESNLRPKKYLDVLHESSFLKLFPICCTFSIDRSVAIYFYSTSSYFSVFSFEEIVRTACDYLLFKGTALSRLSRLKSFIHSMSDSPLLRDSNISLDFLLASITNASFIFDFSCFKHTLVLLPSSSSDYINASLFEICNGQLIPFNCNPGSSDVIYYIKSINNTESSLSTQISCSIIEGSLSNTEIAWSFDDVTLIYNSHFSPDSQSLSFKSPPSSWRSKPSKSNAIPVVIISPVADDLLPILPLAKAFDAKGYAVNAITYGLLNRPSFDTLEQQSDRISDFIETEKPCVFVGYSYSGLIVNHLSTIYKSSEYRFVVVDTPNPLLLQHELDQLPSDNKLFWLSQVCRRLLKSIDCDEYKIEEIIDFIDQSSAPFVFIVKEVRYRLITLGAISYSTAVDDLLCWIDASQAQFKLFRRYQLKSSECKTTFVCASTSKHGTSAKQSWDSYCSDLRVINVHADHYSILKSTKIDKYIDDLVQSLV